MIGRWISAHRSAVATATSGAVIAALVATVAVVSTGYTAQRVDLDDGAVWVANGAESLVGRANGQVFELNSVVGADGADLEVVQDADTLLLVDRTNASLDTIDPATSEIGETIALPPQQTEVHLAGDNAVIHETGTGEVWIVGAADLPGFDPLSTATRSFGEGAAVAVDDSGMLYAYRPDDAQLFRIDATRGDVVDAQWQVELPDPSGDFEVSAAGGRWGVLDSSTRRLATETGVVDLAELIGADGQPHLMQPSTSATRLLVGHSRGLIALDAENGAEPLAEGRQGAAAAPIVRGGCEFAAWSDGGAMRTCGTGDPVELTLEGMPAGARLSFAARNSHVLLNDTRDGSSWAVQQRGELIDNWSELLVDDSEQEETEQDDEDTPPDVEEQQQPPVAVDDAFGARPGTSSVLPVLLNDYDPNGDVLVISELTPLDEAIGRVDPINRGQQVQITLEPTASGVVGFGYTITDGRGGSASATVTVTIRTPDQNGPPQQVRTSKTTVKSGGRVETEVLGDWVDPDGDPFYLVSASTAGDGDATSKPDGTVVFVDNADGGELKNATLAVSDGAALGTGVLAVTVRPAGEVPIIADPFIVQTYAGQDVTVRPLEHVRGGDGPVRLNAVPAKTGVTVEPSFPAGTFTFVSDQVRTHYLEYVVTDDQQTVTGVVRIDVAAPPDASTRPITVPKTVFVTALTQETVEVAATDIDPAGGVLLVTAVDDLPVSSGVQAEVLDQRSVRVTLIGPQPEPVRFGYVVSNGLAETPGSITVVEIPRPDQLQAPLAVDDAATARVGDVIDIPVLDNDEQPDGFDIELVPDLVEDVPEGGGLLFASGDRLRYLAPDRAGDYSAAYAIEGPAGQRAEARVTISVRERNAATNSAPIPRTVTARAVAGTTVRIDIPLSGIDPDGDAVQLLGTDALPEDGSVVETTPDGFSYEAGAYAAGTDTFTYTVVDGLGTRATGTVRVGVTPRVDGGRSPVANEDEVTIRPGKTVSVQVLANDSDPDGSALQVIAVQPNDEGVEAVVVEDQIVDITPPREPGAYGLVYTIQNAFGGTSQNFIEVTVDPDAPLARPVATDTILTVADVIDRETVDVAVLDGVFFADGDASELGVEILPRFGDAAEVRPDGRIRVTIEDESQIIPFALTHPDDDGVRGYAFIRVPGLEDALPQIDPDARKLRVLSGDTLEIDIDDHVVALGSTQVRLTGSTSVRATHADGSDLVAGPSTLRYTSAEGYFGPASITFEVTDGVSADDPEGRVAILSLPITVEARSNQPPVFVGSSIDFEPGQEREIDLLRLTDYPHPEDLAELEYSVLKPLPAGFSVSLNGQRLVVRAAPGAQKGTTTTVSVGVRDEAAEGEAGRVRLNVVASTRPLAQPRADEQIAPRGQTTVVDVLANDQAGNPFPDEPLRVVAVRGLDGGTLPQGVRITPSEDRSRLSVQVSASAPPVDTNLQYQVADATGDPERYVWGSVRISVQDRPEPVSNVRVTEFGDRWLRLTWTPGGFNNAPITEYRVAVTSAADGSPVSSTVCSGPSSCTVSTPGNGPGSSVRLAVSAVNAIGASDATPNAGPIWSDIIPPAPVALSSTPLDQGLRVTWRKPAEAASASPISYYEVTVGGVTQNVAVAEGDPAGTAYSRSITAASIANGSDTLYTVSARNGAPNSLATWNSASATGRAAGSPIVTGPIVTGSPTGGGTSISVSWAGAFAPNGAAIREYWAVAYTGAPPSCVVEGVASGSPQLTVEPTGTSVRRVGAGSGTSAELPGLAANTSYRVSVFAHNGQGCERVDATAPVTPRVAPAEVDAGSLAIVDPTPGGDGRFFDSRLTGLAASSDVDSFVYRLGGEGVDASSSGVLPLTPSGTPLGTASSRHYGVADLTVQVKACASYPEGRLCSAEWSAPRALAVAVDTAFIGTPQARDNADDIVQPTGTWSWVAPARPAGYQSVTYRCAPDASATFPVQAGVGTCENRALLGLFSPLIISITTPDGDVFTRSYAWDAHVSG